MSNQDDPVTGEDSAMGEVLAPTQSKLSTSPAAVEQSNQISSQKASRGSLIKGSFHQAPRIPPSLQKKMAAVRNSIHPLLYRALTSSPVP
jgi:hypothetical protein